jgi:hypothetical protein
MVPPPARRRVGDEPLCREGSRAKEVGELLESFHELKLNVPASVSRVTTMVEPVLNVAP